MSFREPIIDLHTHSNASDGTEQPAEVIRQAAAAGLDVVALSDHDTTAGWDDAFGAAKAAGISFIPAMEMSAREGFRSVHVLAYLIDPTDAGLLSILGEVRTARAQRARHMVEAISADFALDWSQVSHQVTADATIGRPHIADALVAAGHVANRSEAFETILHPRSGYYVPHYAPTPLEAVTAIRAAGGVPVIAHPSGSRGKSLTEHQIGDLVDAGLAGLEVYHRDNSEAGKFWLLKLAAHHNLLVTGSSDYHGSGKPNELAENTTSRATLEAILEQGSGTEPFLAF